MFILNKVLKMALMLAALSLISLSGHAKKHKVQYVSLFSGIYKDINIPFAPKNFARTGDYKNCVKLQYNPKDKILRINPKKAKICSLFISNKKTGKIIYEFRLDVKNTNVAKTAKEIQSLLRDIEGIKIKILNNRVIVDGEVILPGDVSRIFSVVNQYPEQATSIVRLSPMAQVKIARYMERAINNPEISVKAVNGVFLLEGFANTKSEKDRAFILAQAYLPDDVSRESDAIKLTKKVVKDKIINLVTVKEAPKAPPKKIIQIVVHYVELNKDYQKGFKFQWTPGIGDESGLQFSTGSRGPSSILSTITGTITNLFPKLNWAKQHGHARVLKSTSLIVQDGEKGTINAVSKIPFSQIGKDGNTSTQFEPVGVKLSITPQILGERSDSIQLKANFGVSAISGETERGPIISNNLIDTTIVVRSGQSAAVGGLVTSSTSTGYNKLPKNVRNPIITLYSSKNFMKKQSQFVVFMTPIIKSSASSGVDQIKRKFRIKD